MKLLKKLLIILLISIIVIFSLIPPKVVKAAVKVTDVENAIADVAEDFLKRFGDMTIYDCGIKDGYDNDYTKSHVKRFWGREQAYINRVTSGIAYNLSGVGEPYENKYAIDCVGFVNMIISRATSIGNDSFTLFAAPVSNDNCYGSCILAIFYGVEGVDYVGNKKEEVQRGDIICWPDHVAIAVGNGEMIHSAGMGPGGSISKNPITSIHEGKGYYLLRIQKDMASSMKYDQLKNDWYASPYNYSIDGEVMDYSVTYNRAYGNADKFEYNGMPLSGAYLGHDDSNWLIDALKDVADWLVGVITLGYKIQIVGWTAMFQNIATSIVNLIVNENSEGAVTAENILFNKIQILDINFFNFDEAGGTKIEADDLVYILRQNVASLYISIRSIAIIIMLVILIYVGIRMALSTVSENKAKYKKMFLGWIVGFIVIMFIHYFMVFIINLNEQFINFMQPTNNATVIYDEVRSYAYEIPASKGWTGAIMYVFLVYYMIKLLLFYFKRLMVVDILSVIAPILGITYAIEKVKGKSKSLTTWMKEFSFNVLIQSIHVIIYFVFMKIIYSSIMSEVNIVKLLPYAILMILVLNLMLRSEKIIKKIFGLKSNTIKDITDTVLQTSSSLMTAYALSKPLVNFGKKKIANVYDNSVKDSINRRYINLENSLQDVKNSKLATDIQKEIDRLKQEEINQRKEYNKNAMDLTKNVFSGMRGMVTAVPMMFEQGPIKGTISIITAGTNLNSRMKPVKDLDIDEDRIDALLKKYGMLPVNSTISQTRSSSANATKTGSSSTNAIQTAGAQTRTLNTKKIKPKVKRTMGGFIAASATARATTKAKNIWKDGKEEKTKLSNPYQSARIELLYQLQSKVLEEEKKMNSSIDTLRNNGFPPIYYTPGPNESETIIAMNLQLQNQYLKELEINLKQAVAGNPTVTRDNVAQQLLNTNKTSLNLADLQKTLDEIAKENDFEVGTEFEENLRKEVARNAVNVVEGKNTEINKDAIRNEVLQKVEIALKNNNWDETTAQNEIEMAVTKDVSEEVIKNLSASELTSIITSAINSKGSLKKKSVNPSFEPLVNSVEKIADMNNDIAELKGEKYDADELIETILNRNISKSDKI